MRRKSEFKEVEKKPEGGMKKTLIIILALIILGAGSFGGVYYYKKSSSKVDKPIVEVKVLAASDMMVRLADENGKRYLKTTVSISYDKNNKKLGKEIEEKNPEINDKILFYLMSKESTEFTAAKEENVKKGLIEELNKLLNQGKVENIYFDTLLVQ